MNILSNLFLLSNISFQNEQINLFHNNQSIWKAMSRYFRLVVQKVGKPISRFPLEYNTAA